jgi:hypothetical protein
MAFKLVLQLESIADLTVELDSSVSGDSKDGVIGRERVVGDGVVEKVVDFGRGHDEYRLR